MRLHQVTVAFGFFLAVESAMFGGPSMATQKGMMLSTFGRAPDTVRQDVRDLAAYGATLVRFPIYLSDNPDVDWWIGTIDSVLTECEALGVTIVIDMHHPSPSVPADQQGQAMKRWTRSDDDAFVARWTKIVERFKNRGSLWYDLCNEPTHPQWRKLALRTARKIRTMDQKHPIVFSPKGTTTASASGAKPLPGIDKQILQFHLYDWSKQIQFPPEIGGLARSYPNSVQTRAGLRTRLQRLKTLKAQGVRVYVGEVAIWRDHPNAAQFLTDVTAICDEFGLDLTIHAFREWQGWNYEGTDSWPVITNWLARR